MKTKLFIFVQVFIILWLVFAAFIYFFKFSPAANCHLRQGCISLGHTTWQIQSNSAHAYYFESLKSSIGIDSQGSHIFNPIIFILGGILFLYLANFIYEKFVSKKKLLELTLSPFSIFLIFTVVFFISYQCWLNFYDLTIPIKFTSIFVRFPLLVIQVGAIFLLCLALGRKIIKQFFNQILELKDNLAQFLFSFAFGLMAIIFLLFILALFKLLFFNFVLGLMLIILVLSYDQVWFWLKNFFTKNITIKTSFFDPKVFLFLLIIVFMAHNFLDNLRPSPIGYDDLTVYINNPKTMAQEGHLLSGTMSHYWELFTSLGIILYKSVNATLLLSFLGSLLSLVAVYFLTRVYFVMRGLEQVKAQTMAVLCATIFYTLPMVAFQSSKDLKVDLITIIFAVLALFSFWQWRKDYIDNKKMNIWLYISAFLVGFAIAIKFTNLFFAAILAIYALWTVFSQYRFEFKKYTLVLWFILITLMPVLPIMARNLYQTKSLTVANMRFGQAVVESIKIDPTFTGSVAQPDYAKYMRDNSTGGREEVGRYIGYDKWYKKYLLLPFRTTTNYFVSGTYIDISFLFLAFVPLALLLYFKDKDKSKKRIFFEMGVLAIIFWLIWAFTASGIIWYGLSGFIFLLLLLVEALYQIRVNCHRFVYYFCIICVVIWFICATALRTTFIPSYNLVLDPASLKYARGEFDQKMYLDNKFQPYIGIIDTINQDIKTNLNNPPIVYRVGTFYKYMIDYNDRTVLDDQMLDKFAFAFQDKDYQKTLERFKNTGIKYLIIDRSLMNLDSTPEKSLVNKGVDFLNFLQQNQTNLQLLNDPKDDKIMIFKVISS